MRTVLLVLVVVLVIVSSMAGLYNSPGDFKDSETPAQFIVVLAGATYGIAGVAVLLALWRRSRWLTHAAVVWAGATITAGGIAPVAFGEEPVIIGIVSGLAIFLLVGPVVYFLHRTKGRRHELR